MSIIRAFWQNNYRRIIKKYVAAYRIRKNERTISHDPDYGPKPLYGGGSRRSVLAPLGNNCSPGVKMLRNFVLLILAISCNAVLVA